MKVVIALIVDPQQNILITQRPFDVPHGGYWEFPGGKVEIDETAESALLREIKEEVGLELHHYQLLGEVVHAYPNKKVQFIIFLVTHFTGIPRCCEKQLALKWVKPQELKDQKFPEANKEIINMYSNLDNHFLNSGIAFLKYKQCNS